jgi:hypothetical protein
MHFVICMRKGKKMRIHESITIERVLPAAEESMFDVGNAGFCLACGADANGCEPDARNYECACCGEKQVFGAEEVLIMIG